MIINMNPCWKYMTNTPIKQVHHIVEEAGESLKACLDMDSDATDEEVMDVIQSCITYLQIKGYSQEMVDRLADEMYKKNASRGYYQSSERTCSNCAFTLCLDASIKKFNGCKNWRPKEAQQ